MARFSYVREALGDEVAAPSGYYVPVQEELVDYNGRLLLCVAGTACIDASCCGVGSWNYVRVEGYVVEPSGLPTIGDGEPLAIETIEDVRQQEAIAKLLRETYPGVRVEFR